MVSSLATLLFSVKKKCSEPIKRLRAESRYFLRSTGHSPLLSGRISDVSKELVAAKKVAANICYSFPSLINAQGDLVILMSRAKLLQRHLEWIAHQYNTTVPRPKESYDAHISEDHEWQRLLEWQFDECQDFARAADIPLTDTMGMNLIHYYQKTSIDIGLTALRALIKDHLAKLNLLREETYAADFSNRWSAAINSTISLADHT
jgi:hypothetical protein